MRRLYRVYPVTTSGKDSYWEWLRVMNVTKANQDLKWGLLVCMLLNAAFAAFSAEYEVDGEIVQTKYRQDGSVQFQTRSKFTVFVRDCAWLIQNHRPR